MLSQTSRYALHLLGYLATRPGEQVRGEDAAAATGVPATYIPKILNQLRKAGLVDTKRGWHGGFRLRESAFDRPIRDVLAALDGVDSVERSDCAFGLPQCDESNPCPLHDQWEEVRSRYLEMISETRIRDLAGD